MNALWVIGALFLAAVAGVVLMFVMAECWGWLCMKDPGEFFRRPVRKTREQEQAEIDAIYNHAFYHNALRESHLPLIRGDYMDVETEPFFLDAEPSSWSDPKEAA